MTALYCIAWAVIAAVTVWGITLARASAAMARLRADMRKEVGYWQAETSRARAHAAQLARDTATRAAAWKESRDDMIAMMPLIASAHDSSACSHCAAEDGIETT